MSTAPLHRVIVGEDSEGESDEAVYEHPAPQADSEAEESEEASSSSDQREEQPDEEHGDTWRQVHSRILSGSVDGLCTMQSAMMERIKPSVEAAMERIQELMMNQKELLSRVSARDAELTGNERIGKIDSTMKKCAAYAQKVDRLTANMAEISSVLERIKKKADDLRVDAQSYAIKKEEKREERQQWNLFYAAKPSESVSSD